MKWPTWLIVAAYLIGLVSLCYGGPPRSVICVFSAFGLVFGLVRWFQEH